MFPLVCLLYSMSTHSVRKLSKDGWQLRHSVQASCGLSVWPQCLPQVVASAGPGLEQHRGGLSCSQFSWLRSRVPSPRLLTPLLPHFRGETRLHLSSPFSWKISGIICKPSEPGVQLFRNQSDLFSWSASLSLLYPLHPHCTVLPLTHLSLPATVCVALEQTGSQLKAARLNPSSVVCIKRPHSEWRRWVPLFNPNNWTGLHLHCSPRGSVLRTQKYCHVGSQPLL